MRHPGRWLASFGAQNAVKEISATSARETQVPLPSSKTAPRTWGHA